MMPSSAGRWQDENVKIIIQIVVVEKREDYLGGTTRAGYFLNIFTGNII